MRLGAAGRKQGQDRPRRAVPWSGSIPWGPAEAPVVRLGCVSEGSLKVPRHGPQHLLELLPLLPADHSCAGC